MRAPGVGDRVMLVGVNHGLFSEYPKVMEDMGRDVFLVKFSKSVGMSWYSRTHGHHCLYVYKSDVRLVSQQLELFDDGM